MATTVSYSGSAASQNLGTVNIGSSTSVVLSFNVSGGAIGSVQVVTQGTPNLDFTDAGGGSCTGGTTTACTVDVTFRPMYAGLRRGAVLFWSGASNTGSVVGKAFIYGAGNGGQIVYGPPVISSLAAPSGFTSSWNQPEGVTFDGTGDLYVDDANNNQFVKIPVSGAASAIGPTVGGFLLSDPLASFVDGAGDLIISDNNDQRLVEVPVGGSAFSIAPASIGGHPFTYPLGIVVDGLGDIYVTDEGNYRVLKLANIQTNGSATESIVNLAGKTLLWPTDVWLDAAGDLYISDFGQDFNTSDPPANPQILEVFANGTVQKLATPGCTLSFPVSVEGDAAGNLFIGDDTVTFSGGSLNFTGARMIEVPAGGGNCIVTTSFGTVDTSLGTGNINGAIGIGQVNLSAGGDIYVSDYSRNVIVKMQRSVAPTVNFSHPTTINTLDTTDGTQSVQITNIGTATLDFDGLTYPTDFPSGSVSNQCTSSSVVAVNGSCFVGIEFFPKSSGTLSEDVTLFNNASGGTQSIPVTGTSPGVAPSFSSGNSATFTVGVPGTFTVSANGTPAPTFSETGTLPSGVTLSSGGVLAGTPGAGTGGSYVITLTANNGIGSPATQSFTLTVDQPPSLTSGNSTTFTVGTAGSFNATATGFPAPTFSESGTLPSGVTLSTSGVLSGAPAAGTGGQYPLTITASNGVGSPAAQTFTLTVNQAPAITSANSTGFTSGTPGSFTVTTTGAPITILSESGILPGGITFVDNHNGTATISGTADLAASYPITITAQNGVSPNATQSFTFAVNPGAATQFVIPGGPAPFFTAFPFTITAEDAAGNLATSYNGTVQLTSTDPGFVNLGPYTLTNGVVVASAALKTAGTDFITATDTVNSSIHGTGTFVVQPGAASHFGVSAPSSAYVGSPLSYTVTAYDLFNNVATDYTGTVVFASTDPNAVLPASTTIVNGIGTFSATLENAGTQTITAIDSANSLTATSGNIVVTVPALVVTTATDDAGAASNCTVQATPGTGTDASCSLRDALLESASIGSANISFDSTAFSSAQTIAPSSALPVIPANTSIAGPTSGSGAALTNLVTIDGGGASLGAPVFTVNDNALAVAIQNLILTNGSGSNAGGIFNGYQSSLTVRNCAVSGNSSATGTGGIFNNYNATLAVVGSTISGNSGVVGGISSESGGSINVSNSTLAGNTSTNSGGAINNDGATISIQNSTVSGNSAQFGGGGIRAAAGATLLANSIVAGNTASADPDIQGTASADSSFNLIGDGTGLTGISNGANGNQIGTSVSPLALMLAPLANYGGSTQTQLPLPGSPAICGGVLANLPSGITLDQRGLPNTNTGYPGYSAGNPCVDAGAVQTNYAIAFSQQPSDSSTTATVGVGVAISPAPAVSVTESGNGISGGNVTLSDLSGSLVGTATQANVSGTATFTGITVTNGYTNDTLTATMPVNPGASLTVLSYPFNVSTIAPKLTAPSGPSAISGSTQFTWDPGAGVQSFRLKIGVVGPNSSDIFDSGSLAKTVTSQTVNIPANGTTIYVRLAYVIAGTAQFIDYTFTTTGTSTPPALTAPSGAGAISGSTLFTWDPGAGARYFHLRIGINQAGSGDIYDSGNVAGSISSETVTIPANGATLYVRLSYFENGAWSSNDYTFTESGTPIAPSLTAPAGMASQSGRTHFTWDPGTGVTGFVFKVGTTLYGSDIFNSGKLAPSVTSETVDISATTVFVQIGYAVNGVWLHKDYTFGVVAPALTSPIAPTPISGSTLFTWDPGVGSTTFRLKVGTSSPGSSDLADTSNVGASVTSVSANVPANGATVYVRLAYIANGIEQHIDYTFTEAGTVTPPALTSPIGPTAISGSTLFTWVPGAGSTTFRLRVGTTGPGSTDLADTGNVPTSVTSVSANVPANGGTVYVRLAYIANGVSQHIDYTFTETGP